MEQQTKHRWLVHAVSAAAVLSVTYGVGNFAWIIAHKSEYSALPRTPVDLKLWLFNLPFFLLGIVWLTTRLSRSDVQSYLEIEARHPGLKQVTILGIAVGAAAVMAVLVVALSLA